MAMIMADLDRLEICLMDIQNLRLGYESCKEETIGLRKENAILYTSNKKLTEKINDVSAKNQQLKKKRVLWGIGGAVLGAFAYAVLIK